jgi:flavodoxin
MKILLVYYSFTGNTEKIAGKIRDKIGKPHTVDLVKVFPEKNTSYLSKSFSSLLGRSLPVKMEKIANKYDMVIIGFPVWALSPSAYFNTIIDLVESKGPCILVCSCSSTYARAMRKAKKRAERRGFTVQHTEVFQESESVEQRDDKIRALVEALA